MKYESLFRTCSADGRVWNLSRNYKMKYNFTLKGKVPSQKTSYEIVKSRMYLKSEVTEWRNFALLQIKSQLNKLSGQERVFLPINAPVELEILFQCDLKRDLDNMVGSVCDMLQIANIITNDKNIFKITAAKIESPEEETRLSVLTP